MPESNQRTQPGKRRPPRLVYRLAFASDEPLDEVALGRLSANSDLPSTSELRTYPEKE